MKTLCPLFAILLLAGCSSMRPSSQAPFDSETVLVTYHVKPGSEDQFQALLAHAWQVYQSEGAVYAQPHVLVRDTEDENKTRFVEVFTWRKSPDHPSPAILALWKQEMALCEKRDGHTAFEGGEVQLVTGK